MSEDKIYLNVTPKDTSKESTTGTNMSEKMSGEDQGKGNAQSPEEANCCLVTVDEMGLLKLKLTILAILCVILGSFLVAFQVLYFMRVENAGVEEQLDLLRVEYANATLAFQANMSERLEMLQEEFDNATAMTRTLEANLTETERMLIEQKNINDNVTKENTKLKTELQGVRKCADDWEYFNGTFYHFSTDEKTWTESRDACVTMGGHLVIINSQQELDYLKDKTYHWIGLTDAQEEGTWRWVDNTPLTDPRLWGPHQPDNWNNYEDCAWIDSNQNWNDAACGSTFKRICESRSCKI